MHHANSILLRSPRDTFLEWSLAIIFDRTTKSLALPRLRASHGQLPAARFDSLRVIIVHDHAAMLGRYDKRQRGTRARCEQGSFAECDEFRIDRCIVDTSVRTLDIELGNLSTTVPDEHSSTSRSKVMERQAGGSE